jgi:hypothetical protein
LLNNTTVESIPGLKKLVSKSEWKEERREAGNQGGR